MKNFSKLVFGEPILSMKNRDININVTGKHIHRTPVEITNPHKEPKSDWWDEICKKHGEKNYFPKGKKKK